MLKGGTDSTSAGSSLRNTPPPHRTSPPQPRPLPSTASASITIKHKSQHKPPAPDCRLHADSSCAVSCDLCAGIICAGVRRPRSLRESASTAVTLATRTHKKLVPKVNGRVRAPNYLFVFMIVACRFCQSVPPSLIFGFVVPGPDFDFVVPPAGPKLAIETLFTAKLMLF